VTEQFANKIETTVASAYTAASGTLIVASDTGFPATGTFRIRLANAEGTILRVDSRVGTTLTVTVEVDDGDAAVGVAATIVLTAGAIAQLKTDVGGGGGGGGGWWPTFVPQDMTGFTWVNQGGASISFANAISLLDIPAAGGTNLRALVDTAPATPYVVTAALIIRTFRTNNNAIGLVFRESGTGQLMILQVASIAASLVISVAKYNDPTSFNSGVASHDYTGAIIPTPLFLRLEDDGTDITFSYSWDGWNFVEIFTETRSTFLPPDQIGIGGDIGGSDSAMSVLSWDIA
jgi:hypothetical protein